MGRIVCLDVGDVRIGVAVSDALRMIASPYTVLCGLPRNMDGTEGFQAEKVRLFAAQIEKAGMEVRFEDERLSTVSAEHALIEGGMHRMDRKDHVDKVAAAVILQGYLDRNS